MTRKLAGFGLAFALAELAAAYLPPLASLLTAALFISLFLFAAFTQRRAARFALPAVAGLLAGLVWSAAYQLAVVKPAQSLAGQTYACTAIVQPDAETSWQPGNVRATLLITRLDGRKTSLKVYCTDLPYSEAGDIITGQFQLQPLRADSYRMSRYAKGTWLGASYQADYIWQGTSDALPYRLYHLRQAFAKRLTTYLPKNLAGVEAAMLLGEKSELTDEWSDTFRTAGIAHLLAVSGLHVALLCGLFAMGQGRRSRFSVPRVLLQITVLLLYMGLTGLPFSVFRAGVMFLIMLVGSLLLQPGNVRATLLITRLDGRKTSLKVYCTDLPYSEAGDIITGQFQLQPLRADSYRMSRYAKGTWLGASYQADYIWQGTSDALPYRLYHLRQAFAKRLTTYLPKNLAGVEAAMLLGEKSELTDEWSDTFRTAGIAHLLAVSGLHVALLCGLFAMGQGRRSRFSVPRVLLQITVLLLYMGLTGLPFSVFRAGVMFLIMLVGSLLLQPPDSLTALALTAIIIGVQQPFAPCDIGFQLSVCGVLGVLAASALAKRQTQFVQVRYAARHNQRRQTALPLPLAIVLRAVDAVQAAVLATLATLPVLLLHGMAASGAAVPANLLVVWLLGPALRLGILALVLSFVPVLDPLFHGASLLLGIVLRLMTTLAAWCAALPVAHIALPVRYTLWVLAVFAVLAALFWRTRQLRRFVPVGFVCTVAAVMLGGTMQRDVVRLAMVGTAGNGCVVAVQNNRAVVLYRGSAANGRAVQQYLTQNGAPELAAVIDLRTEPGEMPLQAAQLLTIADLPQGLTHLQLLDTVEVDLLHTNAAALAVLDVGGWHAAASAGKLILADPVAVDLYCAGGSCPEAIQAKAILCNQQTPKWLSKAGDTPVYYDAETPTAVVRPGKSVVYEEVQPLAVQ